jgi:hypothetical protein
VQTATNWFIARAAEVVVDVDVVARVEAKALAQRSSSLMQIGNHHNLARDA